MYFLGKCILKNKKCFKVGAYQGFQMIPHFYTSRMSLKNNPNKLKITRKGKLDLTQK
jgi:hypothetical protein